MLRQTDEADSATAATQELAQYVHEGEFLPFLTDVDVTLIVVGPYQPRLYFDPKEQDELVASIQAIGLIDPILLRPLPDGTYQLVGGERRWRAVKVLGWKTVSAVVKEMSDSVAMIVALTDNSHAELSDYEWGKSYQRALSSGDEGSLRALARTLGINHSTVSRRLSMMRLHESIRAILDESPRLITSNYVKQFIDYSTSHADVVINVVRKMRDEGLMQGAAIRLIKVEVAGKKQATLPAVRKVDGLGSVKVAGRKIEVKCVAGVDPERLSQLVENFLATVDRLEIQATEAD